MPTDETDHDRPPQLRRHSRRPSAPAAAVRLVRTALYAACACLGSLWALHLLTQPEPVDVHWSIQVALAGSILAVVGLALFGQRQRWDGPAATLVRLLPKVRQGELPIEELSRVGGGLAPLATMIQDLCRDLRQERAHVASLQEEMRQRVAQRTDALERTIGTLRQQATRDPLTGLFNRRFLDQYLPQAMQRCRSGGLDLSVLMIDLDHFKLLNDTLGHAAGDELLRSVGQIIRSGIRGEDAAFRCGGDEFVILLPGCGPRQAEALAERLIRLVDALAKPLRLPRPPRLSIGMVAMAAEDDGPECLLRRADQALYVTKRQRHTASDPTDSRAA